MKRVLLVLLCAMSLLVTAGAVDPAEAAPYTPKNRIVFNNPKGTKAQKLAIITEINRSIDAAPKGSRIRMAQYLFDIDSTADKLVAAYRRGVHVQVLIDDGTANKQEARVKSVIGTNKKKPSFVATCKRGCMSDIASVMHAKFYLFSAAGAARNVSIISSANPYTGNTYNSWNNSHTIVGDAAIYSSLDRYFSDMILDRTNRNYFRMTTSGKHKMYLFPRAPQKGVQPVVLLDVLNHVSCSGVAKGYGSGGKTVIRVAMWGWTYGRMDMARKLWELHNRGCKVEVILNKGRANAKVMQTLLKRSSKRGQMKVYDAWRDRNNNNKGELYMHHKLLMVNGRWFGHPNTKVVYTGSQNFTAPATLTNNDIVLRVIDNGTYNAYGKNLDYIRRNYTKRMYVAPRRTTWSIAPQGLGVQAAEEAAEAAAAVDTEAEFDSVTDR